MSWIQELYKTYENCQSSIGDISLDGKRPLLPICHMTQTAHIEIAINEQGKFKRARVLLEKRDAKTIIPCSERSSGRAGIKPECHPLCDNLQYVAGDFVKYGGTVTKGFQKDPEEPHRKYLQQLEDWCKPEFVHPKALAVLRYVKKGTVMRDLVDHQVLLVGKNRKLIAAWDKKKDTETPDIFKINGLTSQEDAFVRWEVEAPGELETKVWKDKALWKSWISYYSATKKDKTLCYVTGKELLPAEQHPKYIRRDGDKAKLISSNDLSGFTFRGRFLSDEEAQKRSLPTNQACGVGFEVTQKAHNSLRWLIDRQGYQRGGQAIVAWASSGCAIPDLLADPFSILGVDELPSDEAPTANIAQKLALRLKHKIAGYSAELGSTSSVVVMGMDSATDGRLAITFYRKLTGSDFLKRLEEWHETCSWLHNYRFIDVQQNEIGKKKRKQVPFVGAPAPSDIAEAAYGNRVDDRLRKATVERILPCIIDGQAIPRDLVESAVRRASNKVGLEKWEWEKTLSITCALFKKLKEKENYSMALDLNRKTRDYLYGRLLALADSLEQWALNKANEDRQTNAARLMNRFAERPFSTWKTIELALEPYKARLGGKSKKRQRMIDEVICAFAESDFLSDKRLSGEFLLGYHCQREFLRNDPDKLKDGDDENKETGITN